MAHAHVSKIKLLPTNVPLFCSHRDGQTCKNPGRLWLCSPDDTAISRMCATHGEAVIREFAEKLPEEGEWYLLPGCHSEGGSVWKPNDDWQEKKLVWRDGQVQSAKEES